MAVQAHYHSKASCNVSELRKRSRSSVWLQDLQLEHNNHGLVKGGFGRNEVGRVLNVNTVYSDPESELTCYLSVPARKRINRSDQEISFANSQQQLQEQIMQPQQQINGFSNLPKIQDQKIENRTSTGILKQLTNCDEIRIHQSGGTSTSGRTTPIIINDTDLMAFIRQQNDEIDEFIRHQNERLRLGLEEKRKRHCRSILSSLDQQIARKLKEKDVELESIRNRNSELEEKVKQVMMENQMWQNAARNNEAVVSTLRSSLEQVLIQNIGLTKEGFGDSEDDALSRCSEGILDDFQARKMNENEELRHQKLCKVCRQNEISVLLLPCRHLCVCKDCEAKQESCPVCNSNKNASLQIYVM